MAHAQAATIGAEGGESPFAGGSGILGRISEFKLAFLTASHTLLEGEKDVLQCDRTVFALRICMIANYGAFVVVANLMGVIYFYYVEANAPRERMICAAHVIFVICVFCGAHVTNRYRWMRQTTVCKACTAFLVLANIFGSPLCIPLTRCVNGWHWSGGLIIWIFGAPIAAAVLTDRPVIFVGLCVGLCLVVLLSGIAVVATMQPAVEGNWEEWLVTLSFALMVPYWLLPAMVASLFRFECREHRLRLEAQAAQHTQLLAIRKMLQTLIFSIVPASKVSQLPGLMPTEWYRFPSDEFPDCTLLQMDVHGFTELSSRVSAPELAELIQSLFVSIDYAAECVGQVWKVELIGDCYKAIIGGPQHCSDHAVRGVALGYSIVAICKTIASRLRVRLSVRVGVHSGSATAALVGVRMPRYLLFGRDCEVVDRLEAAADCDSVLLSSTTAAAVRGEWTHGKERQIVLSDGSQCQAWSMEEDEEITPEFDNHLHTLASVEHRFPALLTFLRDFGNSVQRMSSVASLRPFGTEKDSARDSVSNSAHDTERTGSDNVSAASLLTCTQSPMSRQPSLSLSLARQRASLANISPSGLSVPASSALQALNEREPSVRSRPWLAQHIHFLATSTNLIQTRSRARRESENSVHVTGTIELLGLERIPSLERTHSQLQLLNAAPIQSLGFGEGEEEEGEGERPHLRDILKHAAATPLSFQRNVTKIFIFGCGVTAALQTVLLLILSTEDHVETVRWEQSVAESALFLPVLLLGLLIFAAILVYTLGGNWASGWPQAGASTLLFAASVALEGTAGGQHHTRWPALLWAFLGVLIQCASSGLASRIWVLWLLLYLVLGIGMIAWVQRDSGKVLEEGRGVEWWREVLMGWSFATASTLMVVPLALSAALVLRIQRNARELLVSTQEHLQLEDALAAALAPPELSRRFLSGEHLVVDAIDEGTAMFIYLDGYKPLALQYGPAAAVKWVNAIFQRLDACIDHASGAVVKVETFNNFVLVFSTDRKHVRVCLSLAIAMLKSIRHITRPDGAPTSLKMGVSSGEFTTAIIGLQSPRFSIFGDTVNTASRMASSAAPATPASPFVHISLSSWHLLGAEGLDAWKRALGEGIEIEARGEAVEIKGKGLMHTYALSSSGLPSLPAHAS